MAEEQQRQAGRVQEQNHAETMVLLQGGLQIAQRGQWTALIISFCVIIAIIVLIVLDKMDAASFGVAAVLGALATLLADSCGTSANDVQGRTTVKYKPQICLNHWHNQTNKP